VSCEIADTPQERERGLMFRKTLADDAGMFFVFEQPQRTCFWMKNTVIPLDIAFLDKDLVITQITSMDPLTLTWHCADNVAYALEVNRDWFNKHNGTPGISVTLQKKIRWGWFPLK
jgi:hypothetical protein